MTSQKPNPERAALRVDRFLASISELARTLAPQSEEVMSILADTERALKRAGKRMETLSAEYERVEIVPIHGSVIEFTGRRMAAQAFDTARGHVRMEIWETEAGSLVAVDSLDDGARGEMLHASTPTGGIEDQRMAVMEFFGWSKRARSMARKLGWSTRRDIE